MFVVKPYPVDDTTLLSTTVAEDDAPVYDPAVVYAQGDRVVYAHHVWEALASVSGVTPGADDISWLDLGATRPWRMFDPLIESATTDAADISVAIASAEPVGAVALLEVSADAIDISLTDSAGAVVYSANISLRDYGASDWYDYFFGQDDRKRTVVLEDLPPYINVTLHVTVRAIPGEGASVGLMTFGSRTVLGETRYGLSAGILDFSRKQRDVFGRFDFIERGYARTADLPVQVPSSQLEAVNRTLSALRATPALYVGDTAHPETIIYGICRSFRLVLNNPVYSTLNLKLEGMI